MNRIRSAHPGLRFVCLAWVVVSLVGLVVVLAGLSIDRTATEAAGRSNLAQLPALWLWCAAGWAGLTVLWWMLQRAPSKPVSGQRRGWAIISILAIAAAARIAVILTHEPTLSDDVYRYVFDGRNLASGVNPYLIRPEERTRSSQPDAARRFVPLLPPDLARALVPEEDWPGQADIAAKVNNAELYTIYLPVSQYVFAGAGLLVTEPHSSVEASTRIFRAVFIAFDMAAIGLLILWLVRRGRCVWWAALYAWHPLPIIEFAGSGHQDVIGLPLLLLAMMLYSAAPRRFWRWSVLLAMAALVKPVVAPLGAFLLKGQRWQAWLGSAAIGAAVVAGLSAPLLLVDDGQPIDNVRDTSSRFTAKWAHFGSIYEPVRAGLNVIDPIEDAAEPWRKKDEHIRTARIVCGVLLALALIAIFLCRLDVWTSAAAALLAMVLLSPAAHPWYLLWALVLMPMAKNGVVWMASLTLLLGYAVLGDVVEWSVSPWVMAAAYVPVYGWLIITLVRRFAGRSMSDIAGAMNATNSPRP